MPELGANLNEFAPDGQNILHLVCHMNEAYQQKEKKMDLLKFLIEEHKMNSNQHSKQSNGTTGSFTPFMLAVASSPFEDEDFETLEYLLDHGADMNAQLFHILHDGRKYVLHNSVLSWAIASNLPPHVIEWLQNKQ